MPIALKTKQRNCKQLLLTSLLELQQQGSTLHTLCAECSLQIGKYIFVNNFCSIQFHVWLILEAAEIKGRRRQKIKEDKRRCCRKHVGDCHCVASGLVAYRHLSKPEMNEKCYTCPVYCYAALGCFWKSQTTLCLCCGNYCLHWSVFRFHRNEEKHF